MKHRILTPQISNWPKMEEEQCLTYETVLVMVAQWCQPSANISCQSVSDQLDQLASKILTHLHQTNPKHPIFAKIKEDQEEKDVVDICWTQLPNIPGHLHDNVWTPPETKEILLSTNHILYNVEGFSGNREDYYNPNNSYINMILDTKQVQYNTEFFSNNLDS